MPTRSRRPAPETTTPTTSTRSGTRQRAAPGLPPLEEPPPQTTDPALEEQLFTLVTAVSQEDGRSYTPAWAQVAHEAKRRGYLNETGLRLFLTSHGRQYLSNRAGNNDTAPRKGKDWTMTKISRQTRLALKDLSHDTGVLMQEAIGDIIGAVHENRDALTRAARAAGYDHPWEGIAALLRASKR